MKKIAFFVEGQTEQIFINRLVKEILGSGNVTVIQKKISGGSNSPRHEVTRSYNIAKSSQFTVMIYDCGADNRVKSEILENIRSLRESGFSFIVGVRDLYPLSIDELPRLEKGLVFLPTSLREYQKAFDIIVAVREVETWFLAETSHFLKINKKLTGRYIEKHLGFNPDKVNPLTREHPSADLSRIYKLAGRSYTKKCWQVEKLVNRLDFNKIRQEIRYNISSLNTLITIIERFKKK